MSFVTLKNRGLLTLSGKDAREFLQSLITNDIDKLSPNTPLYACLLSAQGKFLHDFFVVERRGKILLDCEGGERAHDLARRLRMYRLRKHVGIEVEEDVTIYGLMDAKNSLDPAILASLNSFPDPRSAALGYRSFIKPENIQEVPFEEWDKLRISLCIPDGSRDLDVGISTMDEAKMDTLGAIDYNKGCYIGQELTARMHYRGLGKKHLAVVKVDDLPKGAVLRSFCGNIGLALVKDDYAGGSDANAHM